MLRKLARKWWFWAGLSCFLLIVLVISGFYTEGKITRARGEARRDEAVRQLDATDPDWRATNFCAKRNASLPPRNKNAAERALQAMALLPSEFDKESSKESWWSELKPGHLPQPEDLCETAPLYRNCGSAIGIARTVKYLPHGGFHLVFNDPNPIATPLPKTQKLRTATQLLQFDAIVLASTGYSSEAIGSCQALLNCGRGLGDEPTTVSQLVRIATIILAKSATERTFGLGEPTSGLAELQVIFAEELTVHRFTYGLRGDRAMMFQMLQDIDDNRIPIQFLTDAFGRGNGPLPAEFRMRVGLAAYRKYIPGQQATLIDLFNRMIEADKLTGPERITAFEQIPQPPRNFENTAVNLLNQYQKVFDADNRARANCATTLTAIACERYRQQFRHWPKTLATIPRGILPEIPEDPYTGQPVIYRITHDGAVVYTTGPDKIDDAGVTLDKPNEPGTDIGFRLFDPRYRRQETLPRIPEQIEYTSPGFEAGDP